MAEVTLTVTKSTVLTDVINTSSYTGAKKKGDAEAYDRIFITDSDKSMLDLYFNEAASGATERMKGCLASETVGDKYEVKLDVSCMFDSSLEDSMQKSLHSYFVAYILSKWYKFCNREDCESYAQDAFGMLDDVVRKLYYRKKPKRTVV
jgi:hypothetical protein